MQNHDNIFVGNRAGNNFLHGHHNIFLGDNAGADETECDFTFIFRKGSSEYRKKITQYQWEWFNSMMSGGEWTELRNPSRGLEYYSIPTTFTQTLSVSGIDNTFVTDSDERRAFNARQGDSNVDIA